MGGGAVDYFGCLFGNPWETGIPARILQETATSPQETLQEILHVILNQKKHLGWDCEIRNQWEKPCLVKYLKFVFIDFSTFLIFF